jgi:hypothetical protein
MKLDIIQEKREGAFFELKMNFSFSLFDNNICLIYQIFIIIL